MDTIDLVFAVGFSTASEVTNSQVEALQDAVRTAVERIGGRVSSKSRRPGHHRQIFLPFSVMMTHVMTVEAGSQMFGVPLDRSSRPSACPETAIKGIGAAQAIGIEKSHDSGVRLASVLALRRQPFSDADATIEITTVAGHLGGLRVDRIGERLEVLLKPLDGLLSRHARNHRNHTAGRRPCSVGAR